MLRKHRRIRKVIIIIAVLGFLFWYSKYAGHHLMLRTDLVPENYWGVTFSKKYANELGLDWKSAYIAILDDLKVRYIRLPVYWDDIEPLMNDFEFGDYEWMIEEGAKRNVSFILNVGRRLPRWPECHQPSWTRGMEEAQIEAEHVSMTNEVVTHFKEYDAITHWQVENEYFFPWFGECPKANIELILAEIQNLKAVDDRPIILTDSGELNSWRKASKYSDILGTTMYRVVWNNWFGYFRAPWPAWLYQAKAVFAGKRHDKMIVAELQAEPWPAEFKKVQDIDETEWTKSFSVRQFKTNAELARRSGFSKAYFWGVEWWYWLKVHGDDSMWKTAQEIIQTNHETE